MIHRAKGTLPRQGGVKTPEGTYEESCGRQGFYGPQAKLYRQHPTTDRLRIDGPLQPRALRPYDVTPDAMAAPQGLPATLLSNDDVRIAVSRQQEAMPRVFCNGAGDELYCIHQGHLACAFGVLPFEPGDSMLIPKGINSRFVYTSPDNFSLLVEARGAFGCPDRGLRGPHAPFDSHAWHVPPSTSIRNSP